MNIFRIRPLPFFLIGVMMSALLAGVLWSLELAALKAEVKVGTGIHNNDPIGAADHFPDSIDWLYAWSSVQGANRPTEITHVWFYEGKEIFKIVLPIKSPQFRTYSRLKVQGKIGHWKVQVMNEEGQPIAGAGFVISASTPIR